MRHRLIAAKLFAVQNPLPERVFETDVFVSGTRAFGPFFVRELRSAGLSDTEIEHFLRARGMHEEDVNSLVSSLLKPAS